MLTRYALRGLDSNRDPAQEYQRADLLFDLENRPPTPTPKSKSRPRDKRGRFISTKAVMVCCTLLLVPVVVGADQGEFCVTDSEYGEEWADLWTDADQWEDRLARTQAHTELEQRGCRFELDEESLTRVWNCKKYDVPCGEETETETETTRRRSTSRFRNLRTEGLCSCSTDVVYVGETTQCNYMGPLDTMWSVDGAGVVGIVSNTNQLAVVIQGRTPGRQATVYWRPDRDCDVLTVALPPEEVERRRAAELAEAARLRAEDRDKWTVKRHVITWGTAIGGPILAAMCATKWCKSGTPQTTSGDSR